MILFCSSKDNESLISGAIYLFIALFSAHLYLTCCFLPVFVAVAPKCMKSPCAGEEESNPAPSKVEEAWSALNDRALVVMVEQLFSHLLKILNICAHVLDDTPPGPAVKVKKALNRS